MNSPTETLLTLQELSAALKISKNHVYRLVKEGRIPFLRVGKCLRFHLGEVLEHFRTHRS